MLTFIEDVFLEQYEDWKRLLLWIAEAVASKLKIAILSLKNEEILKEKERIEKENHIITKATSLMLKIRIWKRLTPIPLNVKSKT